VLLGVPIWAALISVVLAVAALWLATVRLRPARQLLAFHLGFYRVALSVNSRAELTAGSRSHKRVGANGRPRSVSGAIHYPPSPPVLADGLFMHVTPFDKEQEADIEIPNINCTKCTLQVIEFMAAHGFNKDGGYT
jgi:hypothetical protein